MRYAFSPAECERVEGRLAGRRHRIEDILRRSRPHKWHAVETLSLIIGAPANDVRGVEAGDASELVLAAGTRCEMSDSLYLYLVAAEPPSVRPIPGEEVP